MMFGAVFLGLIALAASLYWAKKRDPALSVIAIAERVVVLGLLLFTAIGCLVAGNLQGALIAIGLAIAVNGLYMYATYRAQKKV